MRGEEQLALTPPTPPTVFCPDSVFPCVPEALGSLPGPPLLLVPGRVTPSIQHLPVATRGSTSVLLRSSWGQSHFSPWGHRGASASLHAGIGRAVPRGGRRCLSVQEGTEMVLCSGSAYGWTRAESPSGRIRGISKPLAVPFTERPPQLPTTCHCAVALASWRYR